MSARETPRPPDPIRRFYKEATVDAAEGNAARNALWERALS